MATLTAEEKLAKIREQTRIRNNRFYANNRERILKNIALAKVGQETIKAEIMNNSKVEPKIEKKNVITKISANRYYDNIKKRFIYSYQDLIDLFTVNKAKLSLFTVRNYINYLKKLSTIIPSKDIYETLSNPTQVISTFNNYKFDSDFTQIGVFSIILSIIKYLKFQYPSSTNDAYQFQSTLLHKKIDDKIKARGQTESVIKMIDYVKLILDKFGEDSKQYLLAKLYEAQTLRDDYQNMTIIKSKKNVVSNLQNYIIVPEKGLVSLYIQSYKTDKTYGIIYEKLTKSLSTLIKKYILRDNLEYGNVIFGVSPLSYYISNMSSEVGLANYGINQLRQSKISEVLDNPNISYEERLKLAEAVKHSPLVSLTYIRKLK